MKDTKEEDHTHRGIIIVESHTRGDVNLLGLCFSSRGIYDEPVSIENTRKKKSTECIYFKYNETCCRSTVFNFLVQWRRFHSSGVICAVGKCRYLCEQLVKQLVPAQVHGKVRFNCSIVCGHYRRMFWPKHSRQLVLRQ